MNFKAIFSSVHDEEKKNQKLRILRPEVYSLSRIVIRKILFTMKLTTVLLISTCMQVSAAGYSQKVTLSESNVSLKNVFTQISKQTGYKFFCNEKVVDITRMVTVKLKDATLQSALDACLKDQDLTFTILGNNIVIKEKEKPLNHSIDSDLAPTSDPVPIPFIDIKGHLTNDAGEPLAGATIHIKGTNVGATTDANGNFTINASVNTTLVISYVGYTSREIVVIKQDLGTIVLKLSDNIGEQVVVVGYGSVKRKDLTGSVATVKASDIVKSTATSLNETLQGRAAGVSVVSSEGAPGASVSIFIRAGSSISASNDPLYVIDGFPQLGGSNLNINPNDIASVEVLKDASATAIYGSRGSNGVVIITTKQGKSGKFNISYDGYYSIQQLGRKLQVLNTLQYAQVQHYLQTDPINSDMGDSTFYNWPSFKDSVTHNWQDELYRLAGMYSHNLSFTGGNANLKMMGSLNFTNQDGIAVGTSYKRYTARLNAEANLNNFISNSTEVSLTYQDRAGNSLTGGGGLSYSALKGSPYRPGKFHNLNDYLISNGIPIGGTDGVDPLVDLTEPDIHNTNYFASFNTAFSFKIMKDLILKISGGMNYSVDESDNFYNSNTSVGSFVQGQGSKSNSIYIGLLNENTLSYSRSIGGSGKLDAIAGFSVQKELSSYTGVTNQNFAIQTLGYNNLSLGSNFTAPNSSKSASGIESYFGRVQYSLFDKYIFTGTVRADGSSKFPVHKWGYFPSAGVAWKVSDENFMQKIPQISTLKVRYTYGHTGNESIAPYSTYTSYGSVYYPAVQNNTIVVGVVPRQLGSTDLKWETNIQQDLGLDLGLLKDRIFITADAYLKKSKDLLLDAPLPGYSGFPAVTRNVGDMQVKGMEFALNTVNINGKKFKWTTNFNIAFNKSKVLKLNEGQQYFYTGEVGRYSDVYTVQVGQPLGSIFGYVYDGIINTQEELSTTVQHNSLNINVGTRKYKDISGPDGKPDGVVDELDRTVIGNGNPKFFGGFTNEFTYGNLELSFLFTYSYGNDVINADKAYFESAEWYQGGRLDMLNRWTPEDPQVNRQSWGHAYLNEYSTLTSYLVEDGSYLRLKNLQVAYNFNQKLFKKIAIKSLRVYASAQNLLTFTRYTGYDPEVNFLGSLITPGADLGAYPRSKIYTVGVNLAF